MLQNQQIMLAEQRRKIENSNTMSKVKANNQKGIINEPVISHTKESKEYRKQHQQRNTRLKQEANISAKLAKSVRLMDEGVIEPVEDKRSFAESKLTSHINKRKVLKVLKSY